MIYEFTNYGEIILEDTVTVQDVDFQVTVYEKRRLHITRKRRRVITIIVKLPLNLPNFFLDSLKEDRFLYAGEYVMYDQSQKVKLEGDFNDFFQLYVPEGYERDSLKIFTPDLMAVFINKLPKTDVEIFQNTIFLKTFLPITLNTLCKDLETLLEKAARLYFINNHLANPAVYDNIYLRKSNKHESIKLGNHITNAGRMAYLLMFFIPFFFWLVVCIPIMGPSNLTWMRVFKSILFCIATGVVNVVVLAIVDWNNKH